MIDTDRQNLVIISCPVCPCFATGCLLQPEQRTLVDESGMIRTQMGITIDQKMVAVAWNALYDTTSLQYPVFSSFSISVSSLSQ
jgi:hypothetical protein